MLVSICSSSIQAKVYMYKCLVVVVVVAIQWIKFNTAISQRNVSDPKMTSVQWLE